MKIIKAYKCEYCGKIYKSKAWAIKHELICRKNPKNYQPCFFCEFLEKKEVTYTEQVFKCLIFGGNGKFNDIENKKEIFYCKKKQVYTFPYWCKTPILNEYIDNIAMPILECDLFKKQ